MTKSTKELELSNHPCNLRILRHRERLTSQERGRKEDRRVNIRTTTSGDTGERIRRVTNSRLKLMVRCLHDRNDDNYDDDEDGNPDDEAHLNGKQFEQMPA